mmetsp:Transcript_19132/g.46205  ORF Transcript_19132/g.46205 Transcript_19132/m.46205 type:complete len:108 (+) Transcript_19132:2213-2536(+)
MISRNDRMEDVAAVIAPVAPVGHVSDPPPAKKPRSGRRRLNDVDAEGPALGSHRRTFRHEQHSLICVLRVIPAVLAVDVEDDNDEAFVVEDETMRNMPWSWSMSRSN